MLPQLQFTSPSGVDIVNSNNLPFQIVGAPLKAIVSALSEAMGSNVTTITVADVAASSAARRRLSLIEESSKVRLLEVFLRNESFAF